MKQISFSIFLFSILLLGACAKEQPKVSWLKIDKWILEENTDAVNPQGEMTHNLSQIFITMDGKSLGTFELPVKIPVIGSGKHKFVFIPGIIENGISLTKVRYPFAEQQTTTIDLMLNDTVSYTPKTRYYSNLKFLIEDFESPSMQIDVSTESVGTVGRNNDPTILKWGDKYGEIILTDQDSLVMFVTNFGESLPKFGTNVYLEFDYMNTNSALISTIAYGNGDFFVDNYLQVNPQTEGKAVWKHMYINLKENISYRQNVPNNEIQFTLIKDKKGSDRYFYIDNLKIIYP
ncbi:MAG: hypothetical protein H3C31_04605 [Brumimicrobium sp.]|nr:hypothetical protein [Brumimicrobium sp.]MCO5268801.1 hypothetical protein [Brumimicrobium sp.]